LIRTLAHITAAALVTAAVCVPCASAQPVQLLDVPYLPQSESLCGGAAAAMVMRYWGATDVYADTFATLVDPAAGGIRAEALLHALHERGWGGESFRGDAAALQEALRARRPAIVLIEDRPGRFHYVVVVGWSSGRVIVHDPARAPFRVLNESAFTDAWKQSGFWAVVPAPPPANITSAVPSVNVRSPHPSIDSDPCAAMVDEAVRLANGGDVKNARVTLEAAAANCPRSAAAWRELAGLDALAAEWPAAAKAARLALERDPRDAHAARILGTSLYLEDDPEGALDAWNRIGEPLIDLINVVGLERTRYEVAARTMGLAPRQLLTRASLAAARRRLAELPSVQAVRVAFRPGENGRAQVEAVVLERPLLPSSPVEAAVIGLRTIIDRELTASLSSPSGGGEIWTVRWRWWEHRPRVALAFDAPAPFGGNWGVGVFNERQSYAVPTSTLEESRRRAEFHVSNWTRSGLRWETAVGIDRWRALTSHAVSARLAVVQRFAGDRGSLSADSESWFRGLRTWSLGLRADWRSRTHNEGNVWLARAGEEIVPRNAPLALWPGAGTGQGRDLLLRAHPLLHDGVIRGGAFGPRLTHGGAEWRRWMQPGKKPLRIAPAIFLDVARSTPGIVTSVDGWQSDAGAGLRVAVPGSGVVRIDVAHGLRDGRSALSIGWGR
jgi:hypothetical protein